VRKLPERQLDYLGGNAEFFLICLSHDSLVNHYRTNFELMKSHHYSLTELEMMMPWEREIYITLLIERVKEENQLREQKRT
jgi:hypothetical protein